MAGPLVCLGQEAAGTAWWPEFPGWAVRSKLSVVPDEQTCIRQEKALKD